MATTSQSVPRRGGLAMRIPGGALFAGGAVLFASTTLVNGGNYLFNLILGRWLGPDQFADLSLIVTLLLVASFVTGMLGAVAAKFVAVHHADNDPAGIAAVRSWLRRRSLIFSIVIALLLTAGSPLLQRFFQTASPWPFVILGIGIPLFVDQGAERGVLQGQTRFGVLALSYQAEMWTRLLGGIALVAVGLKVNGAVAAITVSFLASWFIARRAAFGLPKPDALNRIEQTQLTTFAGLVVVGLAGQILINNSDVLIVKHFYDRTDAGHYAALALIGRIVFFATWSIAAVMFPIVAQKQHKGERHRHLLWIALGVVGLGSSVITLATIFIPETLVRVLFGADYLPISSLLWLYALATTLYTLANVVVSYELSAGRGAGNWFVLVGGAAQVLGLWFVHDSLRTVVVVQLAIMSALLIATFAWSSLARFRPTASTPISGAAS